MKSNKERTRQLLEMAWNTKSEARRISIANQVLELEPDNTEALMLKADHSHSKIDEQISLLERAVKSLDVPGNCDESEKAFFFLVLHQRLAYAFFNAGRQAEALKACQTALSFAQDHEEEISLPDENKGLMKMIYYKILIERKDWQKILIDTMREDDDERTLAWAYARLAAAWAMSREDNKKTVCAPLLWDAISMSPNVPFYILNYLEEPSDEDSEEAHDEFNFALFYYDALSFDQELYRWFARGVILFGLLSGRFDEKEYDFMIDALDNLGGYDEFLKMKEILSDTSEDMIVLETLAARKCLSN